MVDEADPLPGHGGVQGAGDDHVGDHEEVLWSQASLMSEGDKLSNTESMASRMSSTGSVAGGEILTDYKREAVNTALATLNVSPFMKKKMKQKDYPNQKLKEITDILRNELNVDEEKDDGQDILKEMKEAFKSCSKKEKYQILTLLPRSWSCSRIEKEFGVSKYIARRAKKLQEEKGPMSYPEQKRAGNELPEATVKAVQDYFNRDEVSRAMPGKKDCVSVRIGGIRKKVQKRLLLSTLREAFHHFHEIIPGHKIGLSKFMELRPKHVVLPSSSGTHTVCVCLYHQNPKLMISGSQISSAPEFKTLIGPEWNSEVKVQHLLARLTCNPALEACWLGACETCSEFPSILKEEILDVFEQLDIENVSYKTWISTDRTEFITVTEEVCDFVDSLIEKLDVLKTHDFIYKQQASYFNETKDNLEEGSTIAVGDFSENFSFVIQDAVQGNHWSKDQATLHPFVCYTNSGGYPLTIPVLFISDHLTHDTIAVYAFQKRLNNLLDEKFRLRSKMIYFSDGCGKQYKNKKNFLNLTYHEDDFGVTADWNFFATAHGKGSWDGLAGSVKRQATLESLRRPLNNQILTAADLFVFARDHFPNLIVQFVPKEEIEKLEEELLSVRFRSALTIKGTLKLHQFRTIEGSNTYVNVKEYSMSSSSKTVKVSKT